MFCTGARKPSFQGWWFVQLTLLVTSPSAFLFGFGARARMEPFGLEDRFFPAGGGFSDLDLELLVRPWREREGEGVKREV